MTIVSTAKAIRYQSPALTWPPAHDSHEKNDAWERGEVITLHGDDDHGTSECQDAQLERGDDVKT